MLPAQAAALEIRNRLLGTKADVNAQRRKPVIVPAPEPVIVPQPGPVIVAAPADDYSDAAKIEALTKQVEALQKLLGIRNEETAMPRRIQKTVAAHYGLSMDELLAPTRVTNIVFARHVAIYLTSKIAPRSLNKIALHFGRVDHTTIMNAIQKIERKRASDPKLDETLTAFIAAFQVSP